MKQKLINYLNRYGAETLIVLCLVLVWALETAHVDLRAKSYHFRGTIGGMELWEYSNDGKSVAIWAEFITNATMVHVVVHTNTTEAWMKSRGY